MKQRPLNPRFPVYGQHEMDADRDIRLENSYKDQDRLERHRRWVYMMKKREEEKEE